MTTFRFPRSMFGTEAAFPDSPEYARAIERHVGAPRLLDRIVDALWWIGTVALVVGVVELLNHLVRH